MTTTTRKKSSDWRRWHRRPVDRGAAGPAQPDRPQRPQARDHGHGQEGDRPRPRARRPDLAVDPADADRDLERREILQRAGVEEPQHGRGQDGHREALARRAADRQRRGQRGDAGRAQDRSGDQCRGQAELGVHALGRRGQARRRQARLAQAPVARPPHHRQRHADLQRFQGRPLGGGGEGQFQRLGPLARRAVFDRGLGHHQRRAAQARPRRSAPRPPTAMPSTSPWRPAASSASRAS